MSAVIQQGVGVVGCYLKGSVCGEAALGVHALLCVHALMFWKLCIQRISNEGEWQ